MPKTLLQNFTAESIQMMRNYAPTLAVDPIIAIQRLESVVRDLVLTNVYQEIQLVAQATGKVIKEETFDSLNNQRCFTFDNVFLKLRLAEDPENRSNGIIVLIESIYGEKNAETNNRLAKRTIAGSARFSDIKVESAHILCAYLTNFLEIASKTIEVGYRWIENYIKSELQTESSKATQDFYLFLGTLFPKEVAEKIWIYALTDDLGISLSSPRELDLAIDNASENKSTIKAWPLEAALSLVLVKMAVEDSFSERAIKSDDSVSHISLNEMDYSMLIKKTEAAHYGNDTIVAQALVVSESINIVAAYPVELKEIVRNELALNQATFQEILSKRSKSVKKYHKMIASYSDPSRWQWGAIGETAGGFVRGVQGIS